MRNNPIEFSEPYQPQNQENINALTEMPPSPKLSENPENKSALIEMSPNPFNENQENISDFTEMPPNQKFSSFNREIETEKEDVESKYINNYLIIYIIFLNK